MRTRKWHRAIGLLMLAPFIGWAITGAIFFLKPGYSGAYEILQPKLYPLDGGLSLQADARWLETRSLKTVLGDHLLVRTSEGWLHMDPRSLNIKSPPDEKDIRLLVADAISSNQARYGQITNIDGNKAITDTGIQIILDWNRLSFAQRGPDTDRIDFLYKIHYLQWSGIPAIDKILGLLGITFVLLLSVLGARLFFGSKKIAA